jgi:pyruvate, water dikinase
MTDSNNEYIKWFEDLRSDDVSIVGGKNASLGEMVYSLKNKGIKVPDGFATTAEAYKKFLTENELKDKILSELQKLKSDNKNIDKVGKTIRKLITDSEFPDDIAAGIKEAYADLSRKSNAENIDVAVRSSATAEDLPDASFAGQQETYLNISGEKDLINACKKCFASLFTDRAIVYRQEKGFDHMKVALSIGVQIMVKADEGSSGVMFTLDTDTGFPDVVVINAAWGLGENVVQGTVNPDEYKIFKPLLNEGKYIPIIEKNLGDKEKKMVYAKTKTTKNIATSEEEKNTYVLDDKEIMKLAEWGVEIEKHYKKPMDIEWAKDGSTNELFIVQARPETVQSQKEAETMKSYSLKEDADPFLTGLSIGDAIATGKSQIILDPDESEKFEEGSILVTGSTDPDWVPIMKKAAGIVTEYGGRTSHAAIVSRELGIPAVVGVEDATEEINEGEEITISCTEGDRGKIYKGKLEFEIKDISLKNIPKTKTEVQMNIASPAAAFRWWRLPAKGIGLARMEFIINNIIKIHPMALIKFDELKDQSAKKEIAEITKLYKDKPQYFVDHLSRGISTIAASQYPDDVVVRMSDFKTNEYADLIGGQEFEAEEENPMLGFRGASRYHSQKYRKGFELECEAIKKVRNEIGLTNVIVMIPFCRTVKEADKVLEVMAEKGLVRGKDGLRIFVMAEIPSNIVLAEKFAERFDGFSIGSNDLTQLALGVDRDSAELKELFDERDETVKILIAQLIESAHKFDKKVGICGQAPSDYPEFVEFLVKQKIDSISLNPDSVIDVQKSINKLES